MPSERLPIRQLSAGNAAEHLITHTLSHQQLELRDCDQDGRKGKGREVRRSWLVPRGRRIRGIRGIRVRQQATKGCHTFYDISCDHDDYAEQRTKRAGNSRSGYRRHENADSNIIYEYDLLEMSPEMIIQIELSSQKKN